MKLDREIYKDIVPPPDHKVIVITLLEVVDGKSRRGNTQVDYGIYQALRNPGSYLNEVVQRLDNDLQKHKEASPT